MPQFRAHLVQEMKDGLVHETSVPWTDLTPETADVLINFVDEAIDNLDEETNDTKLFDTKVYLNDGNGEKIIFQMFMDVDTFNNVMNTEEVS